MSVDGRSDDDLHSKIEELKEILSNVRQDPTPETWNKLRLFSEEKVDFNFDMSERLAESMLEMLIYKAGKRHGKTKNKLLPESSIVLEILFYFITKVSTVQDSLERLQTTQLSKIKLGTHILSKDEDHQLTAIKLLLFISKNFKKFSDPSTYISNWKDVKEVVDIKKEVAGFDLPLPPPHLSMEGRLSVQTSYIDVDVDVALDSLSVDKKTGLSDNEIKRRQAEYGLNELPQPPPPSILLMLFNQIRDFMVIVLFLAAIGGYAIGDYKAGSTLLAVIIINIIIGFSQEYKAEKALNSLLKLEVPRARVLRNREIATINAAELVPGDIVILEEGDQIPADLRLIEVSELNIIEAVLTGESEPIEKMIKPIRKKNNAIGDRKNMAFMTTVVTRGRGRGVVCMIGVRTEAGKISENLKTAKQPKTPLQKRLDQLGKILVVAAIVLCGVIIGIGIGAYRRETIEMVKLAVSLGAAVIPEGLVAVTTVTMAIGVQRMAAKNAIVRKLSAVETLGSVSVICSDKTGTLTEGKMKAVRLWTGNSNYVFEGSALNEGGKVYRRKEHEEVKNSKIPDNFHLYHSLLIMSLCNNSSIQKKKEEDGGGYETIGDPTEVACLLGALSGGVSATELCGDGESKGTWERVKEFAFDSNRKRMSTVYRSKKIHFIFAKGGVESVLSICSHQNIDGEEVKLNKELKNKVEKKATSLAKEGLRVLALAYKIEKGEKDSSFEKINQVEKGLVFVGLVGIIDPERPEVKAAIAKCQGAGIKVCMITGDHQSTAHAIAMKLGITTKGEKPVRGVDIDIMVNTNKLDSLDPFPSVFARVSPENKMQIVQTLQKRRKIVAMTGDGVNDSPAIKNADCGVAMGIAGTDITKQVASIVLKDDNFETIASAVEEGRIIYDNIQKFILYILSCNSAELITAVICVAANAPLPFNTMQILWANIIADVPAAMALGVDAPENDVMKRPPRNPDSHILNLPNAIVLILNSLSMCVITVCLLFTAAWLEKESYKEKHAQSLAFIGLTTMQIFHGFIARSKLRSTFLINPLTNPWMLGAVFGSFGLLIISVYAPGFNSFFETVPLNAIDWGKIAAAVVAHLIITEIIKAFFRLHQNRVNKHKLKEERVEV